MLYINLRMLKISFIKLIYTKLFLHIYNTTHNFVDSVIIFLASSFQWFLSLGDITVSKEHSIVLRRKYSITPASVLKVNLNDELAVII